MPASMKRIRDTMKVKSTARDKGLTLALTLTAYDNGMIELDGVPTNASPHYDAVDGWLGATETVILTINEFRRQVAARTARR